MYTVSVRETPGLEDGRGHDVAERDERHRRRDDEERDVPQPGLEPRAQRRALG
jgi:hypothetical protein